MRMPILSALVAAGLALAPAALLAKNDKTPPGDPCGSGPGRGTGNPCGGNNGNQGANGNAGNAQQPQPFIIARPGNGGGAYITQIGDENEGIIVQEANAHYARIDQHGDRNFASLEQFDGGAHYASVSQSGPDNALRLAQSGGAAQVALLQQTGESNAMRLDQHGSAISSGIAAAQIGNGNSIVMSQFGENNQALLVQEGSGNQMLASQSGDNNQLDWSQIGDNLSHVAINQTGGQAMQVTQTR